MSESVLNDTLKSFDYYVSKLPMYLQQSDGFIEHYRIWYDLLMGDGDTKGIIPSADVLFQLLDIFDANYLNTIISVGDANVTEDEPYGTQSEILDMLGQLFGIKRNLTITYFRDGELHQNEQITLNNQDFLIYIKSQIIKNYCDGSYEQVQEYYDSAGLSMFILTDGVSTATAQLYLAEFDDTEYIYSDNVKKMFLAQLFTIQAMGITYQYSITNINNILIWDKAVEGTYKSWGETDDNAEWII